MGIPISRINYLIYNVMKNYQSYLKENKKLSLLQAINNVINKKSDPYILKDYLGEKLNEFELDDIDNDEIIILCEESDVENILDVEDGVLSYISGLPHNEYYIDDEEKQYIFNQMNDESIELIKDFASELDYKLKLDEERVYDFLLYLKLDYILENYITSLSIAHSDALNKKTNKEIIDIIPFEIDFFRKTQLTIVLEKTKKYIERNKDTDFKTITEIFEHIGDNLPYTYEISYELYDYIDLSDVAQDITSSIRKFYNNGIMDDFWLNIIMSDEIDLFKKYYKKYDWNDSIKYNWNNYEMIHDLPNNILSENSKIYKYIRTIKFFDSIEPLMEKELFRKTKNKEKLAKAKKFNL